MKIIAQIAGVLIVVFLMAIILAFPVKWLWNYLMPELFGLKSIDVWQALAMTTLTGILFKANSSSSSKE